VYELAVKGILQRQMSEQTRVFSCHALLSQQQSLRAQDQSVSNQKGIDVLQIAVKI